MRAVRAVEAVVVVTVRSRGRHRRAERRAPHGHGVDLVDEDDALPAPFGGEPLRLPSHVADDQYIDADEGLSEPRARDRDERAVEAGRNRLREHRLAGARRAVEEDAALTAATGQLERLAGLPEADDSPDLLLRLRLAADVLELDSPVGVAGLEAFDLRDAHHHHRAHQDQEVEDEEEGQDDQLAQERCVPEPIPDPVPDRGRGSPPGHIPAQDPLDDEDDRDEADEPQRDPVPEAPEPVAPTVEDVLLAHLVALEREQARLRDEPPEDQVEQAPECENRGRGRDDRPAERHALRLPQPDECSGRGEDCHERRRAAQRAPLVAQYPVFLPCSEDGRTGRIVGRRHLGSVDAPSRAEVSLVAMHTHRHEGDRRLLLGALCLIAGLMVVELVAGILAGSLALLADAGHLVSDVAALAFAVAAATMAVRPAQGRWTYGFRRLEILSAQANGLLLLIVGIWIVFGAIRRLVSPSDVQGGVVLAVALVGIAVNLVATALLARASRESLNVRGAFLHVATDLAAFIGTAVAGALILVTGWDRFDPIAGLLVAGLMFWGAYGLLRESTRIFLEVAPTNIQPDAVGARAVRGARGRRGARPARLDADGRLSGRLRARSRCPGRRLPRDPRAARAPPGASCSGSSTRRSRSSTLAGRCRSAPRSAAALPFGDRFRRRACNQPGRKDRDRHRRLLRDRRGDRRGPCVTRGSRSPSGLGGSTASKGTSRTSSTSPTPAARSGSSRPRSRRSAGWTSSSTTPAVRSAATRSGSRARTTRSG